MTQYTANGPKSLYPDQVFPAEDAVPDALIYQLTTVGGVVEGDNPQLRVPYVAEDPDAGFTAEGDPITVGDPHLDEILIRTNKVACLCKMSNEADRHAQAASMISSSMSRAVVVKANAALLSSDAAPVGLLATTGMTDAGTLAADNLDALGDAITAVEVNGGTATNITMDPASWGVVRAMKTATGSALPLLGAPADQTERRLFGIPASVSPQMQAGSILVSDKAQIVSAVGPVYVARSDDAYFGDDVTARRVTWRIGWGVVRPDRLAKVAVTLPGG